VNSCISSNLPSFTTRLDLGAVSGTSTLTNNPYHNVVWSTSNVLPGMDISVSDQGTDSNEGLLRAYNMAYYKDSFGDWTDAGFYPYGYFPGRFDAQPDTAPPSAVAPGDPGDILLGLYLNGASSNRSILLSFDAAGFDNVGFRISSIINNNFTARIQIFANAAGTGTALYDSSGDSQFSYLGAGGQCSTLFTTVTHGDPIPCNNAPFVGFTGYGGTARSILISTDDPNGFYMSQLYLGVASPEPGTILMGGCGLALLVFARRRSRRNA
jgi:hypothetical protein